MYPVSSVPTVEVAITGTENSSVPTEVVITDTVHSNVPTAEVVITGPVNSSFSGGGCCYWHCIQ